MQKSTFSLTFSSLCIVMNLVLGTVVDLLHIPMLFMDTLGTIFGAVLLGPFYGVLIGMVTNVVQGALTNPRNIPFALVNMAIGLVVGLVARKFRFTLPVAVVTGLVLAVVAPLIGTPIAVWLYAGLTGDGTDLIFLWLKTSGHKIFTAAFIPRIVGNLLDKVACSAVVALLIPALPAHMLAKGNNPFFSNPSRDS